MARQSDAQYVALYSVVSATHSGLATSVPRLVLVTRSRTPYLWVDVSVRDTYVRGIEDCGGVFFYILETDELFRLPM